MMITQSFYGNSKACPKVLLVVPHGASGFEVFFKRFPDILDHPEIRRSNGAFERFLAVEQDRGSSELAHSIARKLNEMTPEMGIRILELSYPRGLVDGGRIVSHCLRPFLPDALLRRHKDAFIQIHQDSVDYVLDQVSSVSDSGGCVLDIHTMASFCPSEPLDSYQSWESLIPYTRAFDDAYKHGSLRSFDIITADGDGREIAHKPLRDELEKSLGGRFDLSFNHPYAALKHFMMNVYMCHGSGIALDLPKHLLAEDGPDRLDLANFKLCWAKLNRTGLLIAQGVMSYLNLRHQDMPSEP